MFIKETPTQVFPCEYCEIFKNTYFEEHLRTAAFVLKDCQQGISHYYMFSKRISSTFNP